MNLGEQPISELLQRATFREASWQAYAFSLTANENKTNDSFVTEEDADFLWIGTTAVSTGTFEIKITTPDSRARSNIRIRSTLFCGASGSFPANLVEPKLINARGRCYVDIKDLSGAGNTGQVVLVGLKLFGLQR